VSGANRLADAVEQEDIKQIGDLSRWWPGAMFHHINDASPWSLLQNKAGSFAFDVGEAWARGLGERASEWSDTLSQEVESLLNSGRDVRMGGLAFACAVIGQGVLGSDFEHGIYKAGLEANLTISKFGLQELSIWGADWTKQAKQDGDGACWAKQAMEQSLRVYLFENEHEGLAMVKLVDALSGQPQQGWLDGDGTRCAMRWRRLGEKNDGNVALQSFA
jgi:hypothetical protein